MKKIINLIIASVALFVVGCQSKIEVKVAPIQIGTIVDTVTGVNAGTVYAEQDTELAFGAVGRVQKLHVSLGDKVESGTVLAELENQDLKVTVETSARELARLQNLVTDHAVSKRDLDEAKRIAATASAALEKTIIRAPFSGFIAELNLEVGQLAQITAVIPKAPIRLVDTAPRYIKVQFDEIDLRRIKVGLPCRIKILAVSKESFSGQIRSVIEFVSSVKEQDRTAEVEVSIDSESLLPVGASADVEVILNKKENVMLVPARSVLGNKDNRFVYIYDNGKAKKLSIKVGISNFDQVEILEGLKTENLVIIPDDKNSLSDNINVTKVDN